MLTALYTRKTWKNILTNIIGNLQAVTHVNFTDINFKMYNITCSHTENLSTTSKKTTLLCYIYKENVTVRTSYNNEM